MRLYRQLILLVCLCWVLPVAARDATRQLVSVTIVDQHGFSETYTAKDRLKVYQRINFLQPQSYQKVVRTYGADAKGRSRVFITTYHPNGQIKQYLEGVGGGAFGRYQEWHDQGETRLIVRVIGGDLDVSDQALHTFVFDGIAQVFEPSGRPHAEISYSKGKLHGLSTYYFPSGEVSQSVPFADGEREGSARLYYENGALRAETPYSQGVPNGPARGFWEDGTTAYCENFVEGLLEWGEYYDEVGSLIAQVKRGKGMRAFFHDDGRLELSEHVGGIPQGLVKEYDQSGHLARVYTMKGGEKHGEEILYQPASSFQESSESPKPRLSVSWYEGEIHGPAKSWYADGSLESHREIAHNKRNGVSTAWYADGNLMLIEEYVEDKLIKGQYFAKGNSRAVSKVSDGEGVVTLHDPKGSFLEKIEYYQGVPSVE